MSLLAAQATVWEDSTLQLMARIVDINNVLILQGGVSGITLQVTQQDVPTNFTAPTVSISQISDTLINDAKWTIDELGYNFLHTIVPADIPLGDKTYRAEFTFTDTSGNKTPVVFELRTQDLLKS